MFTNNSFLHFIRIDSLSHFTHLDPLPPLFSALVSVSASQYNNTIFMLFLKYYLAFLHFDWLTFWTEPLYIFILWLSTIRPITIQTPRRNLETLFLLEEILVFFTIIWFLKIILSFFYCHWTFFFVITMNIFPMQTRNQKVAVMIIFLLIWNSIMIVCAFSLFLQDLSYLVHDFSLFEEGRV